MLLTLLGSLDTTYDLPSQATVVLFVKLMGMSTRQLEGIVTIR